jgi:uncharacterized membrane protein
MKRPDFATLAALGMAVGLIGLGALSVWAHDFAFQWEPVPKTWPARPVLGVASGLILLAAGAMLLTRRWRAWGALAAAVFIGLWVLVLHLPRAAAKPIDFASWNAVCEPLAMASGAFVAFRELRGRSARIAIWTMGACYVIFGCTHFQYAAFTATMIPAWLPMRVGLAWFTGAIHALSGLALLLGVRRRWAASIEAAMMTSFVLLVHIPRVAAHPGDRFELTMLFIAVTLSSAAWILATSLAVGARAVGASGRA